METSATLIQACERGHVSDAMRALDAKVNPNVFGLDEHENWITPVYAAATGGHTELVQSLIERKAEHTPSDTFSDETPLRSACRKGHAEVVHALLKAQALVNSADRFLRTPLFLACQEGRVDTAKVLIEFKAEIGQMDLHRSAPINPAACYGHTEVVRLLLESKASANSFEGGRTSPLSIAAVNGRSAVVELLAKFKADINVLTGNGKTALYAAASAGRTKVAELLIGLKAEMDRPRDDMRWSAAVGTTPLWIAASHCHIETLKMFIEHKANIDHTSRHGDSALVMSAYTGNESVVRVLVEFRANIYLRGDRGRTAAQWARVRGHGTIADYLENDAPFVPVTFIFSMFSRAFILLAVVLHAHSCGLCFPSLQSPAHRGLFNPACSAPTKRVQPLRLLLP